MENRQLIQRLTQSASAAQPLLDAYTRQSYLDNGLRGGFRCLFPAASACICLGASTAIWNAITAAWCQTPRIQKAMAISDMLQNRRTDLFFDPTLGSRNIRYFLT